MALPMRRPRSKEPMAFRRSAIEALIRPCQRELCGARRPRGAPAQHWHERGSRRTRSPRPRRRTPRTYTALRGSSYSHNSQNLRPSSHSWLEELASAQPSPCLLWCCESSRRSHKYFLPAEDDKSVSGCIFQPCQPRQYGNAVPPSRISSAARNGSSSQRNPLTDGELPRYV